MKYNIPPLFFFFIFIISCTQPTARKYPPTIEKVLSQAKENRSELEDVINHYSKDPSDSLKLKAAYFLIANMPGHHYFKGEILEEYQSFFDITLDKTKTGSHRTIYRSYEDKYGPIVKSKLEKVYDLNSIESDYLINNIDHAFKVYNEQPWCKNISFNAFCNYILPYRVGDEEPEEWREKFYEQYNPLLDSVRSVNGNTIAACKVICRAIKNSIDGGSENIAAFPSLGPEKLDKYRIGTCREQAEFATYIMRALGIPVAMDYTPQWPFRSMGHSWNVVFDKHGKATVFMGTETEPGEPHKQGYKYAKIYRTGFCKNSSGVLTNNIDVTKDFVPTSDIKVKIKFPFGSVSKYMYLAVFNNSDWVPIDWATVKGKAAVFTGVGRDIVYLPIYSSDGGVVPVSDPFLLNKEGKVIPLKPEPGIFHSLTLKRKYPFFKRMDYYIKRMKGGKFQVANQANFSDAIDLFVIDSIPDPKYYEITTKTNRDFRYVRFLSSKGGWGNIAEMEIFGNNGEEYKGSIMGTEGSWEGSDRTKDKVFDKNIISFFDSSIEDGAWVGLDFGSPKTIKKLRYMPRNDGNTIEKGDTYELFYWDKEWKIIEAQIATSDSLIFKKAPIGTLYRLHNATKGVEERIFTYKNKQQVWW